MKGQWIILCILFLGISVQELQAKHIIGGDVTYECLGNGRYKVTMFIYRDCRPQAQAAQLDGDASIAIYLGGSSYRLVSAFQVNLANRDFIDPPEYPCLILPPGLCVERGLYEFEIDFNSWPAAESYYIVYQRCCRNNTISNIVDPGDIGATYFVELTPESMETCNNSPTFRNFPPTVVCVDQEFEFDHSVEDAEGDSIVYRFGTPLEGGGLAGSSFTSPGDPTSCSGVKPTPPCPPPFKKVEFRSPLYSQENPMGGDPQISIDPQTGLITGRPMIQGQFVITVVAEEYRNGEKIGEINRDFQFNVAQCDPTVFARIESALLIDESNAVLRSCGEFTVPFRDSSYEEQFIETYKWTFDIDGKEEVFREKNVEVTFPRLGNYTGQLIVNEGTACSDSTDITISVLPDIGAEFDFEYDTCIAGDVEFSNASFSDARGGITEYIWDFGDGNGSSSPNPSHAYQSSGIWDVSLTVVDGNECRETVQRQISYFPVPPEEVIRSQIEIGCLPASVLFENLPPPIDPNYDITWDFGDGNTGTGYLPVHTYTEEGEYDVGVHVISPIGCEVSAFFPRMITTQPSPVADFDYNPVRPTNLDKMVTFNNKSEAAVAYSWEIERLGIYSTKDLVINFPDSGIYNVALIAIHENGCMDTLVQPVDIEPIVLYTLPNAFSPNGDHTNDVFEGIGVFIGMKDFRMEVFDRWGNMVFTSSDPHLGWDGRIITSDIMAPPGVYVYQVNYLDARNRPKQVYGEVLLIK